MFLLTVNYSRMQKQRLCMKSLYFRTREYNDFAVFGPSFLWKLKNEGLPDPIQELDQKKKTKKNPIKKIKKSAKEMGKLDAFYTTKMSPKLILSGNGVVFPLFALFDFF